MGNSDGGRVVVSGFGAAISKIKFPFLSIKNCIGILEKIEKRILNIRIIFMRMVVDEIG